MCTYSHTAERCSLRGRCVAEVKCGMATCRSWWGSRLFPIVSELNFKSEQLLVVGSSSRSNRSSSRTNSSSGGSSNVTIINKQTNKQTTSSSCLAVVISVCIQHLVTTKISHWWLYGVYLRASCFENPLVCISQKRAAIEGLYMGLNNNLCYVTRHFLYFFPLSRCHFL